MDDFLRFIRTSSSRLFGLRNQPVVAQQPINNAQAGLPTYEVTPCRHVSEASWDSAWDDFVEPKHSNLTGIVFLNPCFARTCYVPVSAFRCGYEDLVEYDTVDNEILVLMKSGRYEHWMRSTIRPDSCFVSMHVCSAALLLQKLCSRCPSLTRLSVHYFYLDDNFVAYAVHKLPNLVSINLENSIGLSLQGYANLGHLEQLAHLNLSGCDLSEQGLAKILDNCRHLESLNVSNNCRITGTYCNNFLFCHD